VHFLHPLLLAGAAAAAVPVVAHLLSPQSRQRLRFSAVAFLPQHPVSAAGRRRLAQPFLMGVRMLLVLLLALWVAAPVGAPPPGAAQSHSAPTASVMVLDASASMNYTLGRKSLLQAARALAHAWVSERAQGDQVGLLIAGAQGGVAQPLTADGALLHEALEARTPAAGSGTADLAAAIAQATAMLPQGSGAKGIVVISDLSQNSLPSGLALGADAPPITWLDAAARPSAQGSPKGALPNVAVTALAALPGPSLEVEVRNFGDAAVTGRGLTLQAGPTLRQRALVDVPAHGTLRKVFAAQGLGGTALQARARLDGSAQDGFVADDVLEARLEVAPVSRVLAVDGAPHSRLAASELYYVERALAEVPKGQPAIALTTVARPALLQALDAGPRPFDVLLLANVGALTAEEGRAVRRAVEDGAGLIVALGDQLVLKGDQDAAAYSAVMPFELRDLMRHPQALQVDVGVPFGAIAQEHPLFADLGEAALAGLRRARTQQFFYAAPHAAPGSRVLLAFEEGAPALLEAPGAPGRGPVLLWTTSLDRDWTDLPTLGVFVPWMQRLVRYAAAPGAEANAARPAIQDTSESDFAPIEAATLLALGQGRPGMGAEEGAPQAHGGQPGARPLVLLSLLLGLTAAWEAWLSRAPSGAGRGPKVASGRGL